MHTHNNQQILSIHHPIAEIKIELKELVDKKLLLKLIKIALDNYAEQALVPAEKVHQLVREKYGDYYHTPGYNLRLYRQRMDLTQVQFAKQCELRQHHLSEMENNKRSIGKKLAKKIAALLQCDYHELL